LDAIQGRGEGAPYVFCDPCALRDDDPDPCALRDDDDCCALRDDDPCGLRGDDPCALLWCQLLLDRPPPLFLDHPHSASSKRSWFPQNQVASSDHILPNPALRCLGALVQQCTSHPCWCILFLAHQSIGVVQLQTPARPKLSLELL